MTKFIDEKSNFGPDGPFSRMVREGLDVVQAREAKAAKDRPRPGLTADDLEGEVGRPEPPKTGTRVAFDTRRAVRLLRAADPDLGALITSIGPFAMELQSAPDTFAALSEAIVHQQLSPKAAATIHRRFTTLLEHSGRGSQPERVLALAGEELREVGLSQAKMRAIRDLAERSLAGEVPTLEEAQAMRDEAVIERLTAVRGVGRWTAEMFLMFRLGRPDVLPLGDYGLRRGFAVAFTGGRVPDAEEVERRGEHWRPYRTVASWYLWRATEAPSR